MMDFAQKRYTARQLLSFLERDVILRGRLPMFSELAYRSDGPAMETYLDTLGDGDWQSLQSGLAAWLGARGYQIDREGKLVVKLPPVPKAPEGSHPPRDLPPTQNKKRQAAPKRRTILNLGEAVEQDWQKVSLDSLSNECLRGIDRRFPPTSAAGQQLVGRKLVNALIGMLSGQAIAAEDGRQLVKTLLYLLCPEATQNQLAVSPLFWRDDALGGLIARSNTHMYQARELYSIAEGVEKLQIDYAELTDRLTHNELTLVFTNAYHLVRAEIDAFGSNKSAASAQPRA